MVQEENPEVRPEEYVVTDYEDGEYDEESDEGEDIKETPSEPHPTETPLNQHVVQESTTGPRAIRARKREDVITQESNELAELLVRQFDI
ncbi:unnamed protein product [Lactuca saligna]|uniref:Uncharacterized protein n=1 Tax=Lactuca saligna TaxID=75948 RepID=A0AA36E283_LACSI|nr:unnamed protein product [Lactuca saligna]